MAGKRNKVTLQDQRDFFSAFYGDGYCECGNGEYSSLEEAEDAICDCMGMLQHSIDRADKGEIAYWRKMLQENKECRRKMLTA